jgi:hypothetical protein
LIRSIHCAGGLIGNQPIPPFGTLIVPVPPFARRVRFFRQPIEATPLMIIGRDSINAARRNVNLPVNSDGPIELSSNVESQLAVQNVGAVNITQMIAVFDVDPI